MPASRMEGIAPRLGCEWEHQQPAYPGISRYDDSLHGLEVAAGLFVGPAGATGLEGLQAKRGKW